MKKYLERLAFTAALGALVTAGWFAVETEASSPARPALVEVAAAAPVVEEPVVAPSAPVEPEAVVDAAPAAPAAVPAAQSLFRTLPEGSEWSYGAGRFHESGRPDGTSAVMLACMANDEHMVRHLIEGALHSMVLRP